MNAKDALKSFSKGLFVSLQSSLEAFENMSSSSKGTGREDIVKQTLGACLPSKYSILSGDIIDTKGHSTGQIDGITVFSSATILRSPISDISLVPAESAGAVLEVKSDLSNQWSEVVQKYDKVKPIFWLPINMLSTRPKDSAKRETMSFHVVALKGYKKIETLKRKLEELIQSAPGKRVLSIMTIDPPAIVIAKEDMAVHIGPNSPEGVMGQWLSYVVGDIDSFFNPKPDIGKYFRLALEE